MSSCEAMLVSDRYPMNKDNTEYKLSSLAIILGKPGDFQIRELENVSIHSKAFFFFFEKLSAISFEVRRPYPTYRDSIVFASKMVSQLSVTTSFRAVISNPRTWV